MIDLNLLKNIMKEVRENKYFLDSLSPNQFVSKEFLINNIKNLNILNSESEIAIFGCWYGSILIPAFYNDVKRITAIDIDKKVISIAKHRIWQARPPEQAFTDYKKVDFITNDVFSWAEDSNRIKRTELIINTSCEHMKPMKELKILNHINSYFAFQSNDMYQFEDHVNCVDSMEDFKQQLPDNAKILIEDDIKDERGTRFLLIGRLETDTPAYYREENEKSDL